MSNAKEKELIEKNLPWPQPIGCYDSDGPRDESQLGEFTIFGVRMSVTMADGQYQTAMRDRYRVECLSCSELLHHATTSATIRVEEHLLEEHKDLVK